MEAKKHSWHGPKQIGMMIYTAILVPDRNKYYRRK